MGIGLGARLRAFGADGGKPHPYGPEGSLAVAYLVLRPLFNRAA